MATANTALQPLCNKVLYVPLAETDPEVQNIVDKETWRQYSGLELIPSEVQLSRTAIEANGSILTNKYSPGARYYGWNEYIDELENICRKRALQAFNLASKWGVNVQPYSGSLYPSFAARTALIQPQDRLMGLGLPDGGHLTHGCYQGNIFNPHLIICGASAYPRDWDYAALKAICEKEGAYLMADIAHTSGLIAAQQLNNPFDYCDVCNHKTLRGPRAVIPNAKTLASGLLEHGYKPQTGGTGNHLVLWDLRPLGLTGSKVEKVCDLLGITINTNFPRKCRIIRFGTSALTPRNIIEDDVKVVAGFLHRVIQLSIVLQKEAGSKMLKDFIRVATTESEGKVGAQMVRELRKEVVAFARKWSLPGADVSTIQRSKRNFKIAMTLRLHWAGVDWVRAQYENSVSTANGISDTVLEISVFGQH
ncbi:hypothetical protein PAXINDRAFT_164102 [Paxillus involutus ATCC 200175]|uniref:Serine hydroxymethyltransferase-like domain-containing protein n=1 Tax=Paxillus involutus ATCC 200175 TaxID=664439 RepID=A0A0C9TW53_PAXIN|nr:hypothetical protein PAXINDRAFT_164102 [Paxillus involutus ATCC 200175]